MLTSKYWASGGPGLNVCIDVIRHKWRLYTIYRMTLENGFFGDMATIKSGFVLCFLDCKIQSKIIRYKVYTRILVKPKFYSSSY